MKMFFQLAAIFLFALFPLAVDLSADGSEQPVESSFPVSALPEAKAGAGSLELSVPAGKTVKFEIFSITGQSIKVVKVSGGFSMTVELPKGFYIVKCESWTKKVMIK